MASKLSQFLKELKRRKVYHVAVVYVLVGLAVAQGADWAFDLLELDNVFSQAIAALLLLGLPVALVLAWAYEVRPEEGKEDVSAETSEERNGLAQDEGTGLLKNTQEPLHPAAVTDQRPGEKPTIAVLPFDDFSPNPDDAYFAGGMHEEILTQLQKVGGLAVRARTSVLRYRENPKPVPEIARELGVQYILEGSARKAGDQVRLTAQLMDAAKDEHLWADNFDRPLTMDSLIAVQAEIARQVALELKAVMSPEADRLSADKPTESLDAYEEYLRGKHFVQRYTKGGFTKGIEHFGRAIEMDENFAAAHVGLGYCYKEMSDLSYMDPAEGYSKARTALTKALELDDTLGEAHAILASMRFVSEWDMQGPEALFRRAAGLSPDSAEVFLLYGSYLMHLGRAEESIEVGRRAVELDPLSPLMNTWYACSFFYANREEESIQVHRRLLELDPNSLWSKIYLSHNYSAMGDHAQALVYADEVEAAARSLGDDYVLTYVGGSYAWAGEEEKAREILQTAIELHTQGSMDAVSVAVIFAQLGEHERAFEWLNRAVDEHAGLAVWLKIYGGTFLRDLKPDPRFDEVLRTVGFPA